VHPGNKLMGFICGLAGARKVARSGEIGPNLLTSPSSDRLYVMHAAAVPLQADLGAARGGKVLKQARHRAGGSVCSDRLVATERRVSGLTTSRSPSR
jgi:hypothetical protein